VRGRRRRAPVRQHQCCPGESRRCLAPAADPLGAVLVQAWLERRRCPRGPLNGSEVDLQEYRCNQALTNLCAAGGGGDVGAAAWENQDDGTTAAGLPPVEYLRTMPASPASCGRSASRCQCVPADRMSPVPCRARNSTGFPPESTLWPGANRKLLVRSLPSCSRFCNAAVMPHLATTLDRAT